MLEKKVNLNSSVDADFKVLVYSVNFYPNLKYKYELNKMNLKSTVEQGKSNSIEKNIFDYNLVLIPIQKSNNWSLVVSETLLNLS